MERRFRLKLIGWSDPAHATHCTRTSGGTDHEPAEHRPARPPKARRVDLLAAVSSLLLGACADPTEEEADEGQEGEASGAVTIGSADFPESEVVAYLYAHALEDASVEVSTSMNIGSREAYVPALEDGSIDLIPEYTGNLLFYLDEDSEATDADSINDELPAALEERGLEMLTPPRRNPPTPSSSPQRPPRTGT
ncbi:hypothetical protein [Nesterenkonia pannonica]|uniref:glycine betaine ABC transporter substrate-binding protein n=1 Tax=Nesterenkonia pannonica TaxID=1548602 RepID=UPI0021641FAC|nr:glycine betaine ABC transporter substrate-binding protein [Nesterenkonia pannonica]